MSTPTRQLSPHFRSHEFRCRCGRCDYDNPTPALLDALEAFRDAVGDPVVVTSGLRCPAHNKSVGGEARSYHVTGQAADVRVPAMTLREAYDTALTVPALRNGGIGVYPDPGERFLHLDVGPCRRWGRIRGRYVGLDAALRRA
jgi:uncharacterized protein YcbK (DUF882 family)